MFEKRKFIKKAACVKNCPSCLSPENDVLDAVLKLYSFERMLIMRVI